MAKPPGSAVRSSRRLRQRQQDQEAAASHDEQPQHAKDGATEHEQQVAAQLTYADVDDQAAGPADVEAAAGAAAPASTRKAARAAASRDGRKMRVAATAAAAAWDAEEEPPVEGPSGSDDPAGDSAADLAGALDADQQQQEEDREQGEGSSASDVPAEAGEGAAATQQEDDPADDPAAADGADDGADGNASDEEDNRADGADDGVSHEEETELSALDAFAPDTAVALAAFGTAASAPTAFVQPSAEVSGLARLAAKALYDYAAAYAPAASSSQAAAASALPELHVDGFDAEQIWLQLELQSGPVLKRARRLLRKLGDEPQLLTPETEEALKDVIGGSEDERSSREDSDADLDGDVAGQDLDLDQGQAGNEDGADLDDSGLEDFEGGSSDSGGQPSQACKRKRGEALKPTEDAFMRLDDMERFMEEAEQQAGREGDEDEEDEDFAGFGDGEIEDEEDAELAAVLDNAARLAGKAPPKKLQRGRRRDASDEDDDDEHDGVADMMYEDFFGDRKPQRGQQGRGKARRGAAPDLDDDLAAEHQEADEDRDEDQEDDEDLAAADNGGFEDDAGLDAGEGAEGDELYTAEQLQGLLDGTLDLDTLQPAGGRQINKLGGSAAGGKGGGRGGADNATGEPLSAHERRLQRMQQRIERLQEAAMGEKDWFMRGEADAGARPINSVLEMDLDFERSVKPPPQPTEEATASLEELIRKRVTDHQFDDPPRMVAPPTDKRKTVLELDDKKSAKGLGELYEEEFVQKTTGSVAEDKDERVRAEARALMKALSAKLDALSHFHYAPKPVVEDMTVKADVPALAMEEVAPMVVSEANMRAPEEVFRAGGKGPPKSEAELSREERKRRRAAKKRAGKKHKQQQLGDKRATAVSKGGEANIIGRKSDAALAPASRKKAPQHGRSEFSKSAAVFAKLQDQRNMAAAGIKVAPITDKPAHKASNLKL